MRALVASPSDGLLYSASYGLELPAGDVVGSVVAWNPRSGERIRALPTRTPAVALAVSPDGRLVLMAHENGSASLWVGGRLD